MDHSTQMKAVVQAGCLETPYLRTGRGRPILLLQDTTLEMARWETLLDLLAVYFRVIVPEVGPRVEGDGPDSTFWIRGLVEGLGLDRPGVVAGSSLAPLASTAPGSAAEDHVGRIVLLHRDLNADPPSEDVSILHLCVTGASTDDPGCLPAGIIERAIAFLAGS